ncbi:AraC family transcriptional regulator [Dysgonomonas sp. 216]|uniref:helix-turn-helix domain-containing protein n=1 Tax=Dysgonomonas sp. 216 TaxID=2302934 RepID=UPI0013D18559|nr:helix-turn-helix domain-containing protein [Dysgonomonas sp. 216]NDW18210.1 AraC family transcriptional regulator [Dysgonomonas sp. 216]
MELKKIQVGDLSKEFSPFAMRNFVISDEPITVPLLSIEHPIVFDGIAFIFCRKGKGRTKVNFMEYDVDENTIIVILPHFVTELLSCSDDMELDFLLFSVDFLGDYFARPNLDLSRSMVRQPCLKLTETESENLSEFFSFVVKHYNRNDHPYRQDMAKALLYALLSEIGGLYYSRMKDEFEDKKPSIESRQQELVSSFFKLLLHHNKQEKSLQFYADKMCITPKYLSTVLKEVTGRTAFAWINEALMASAKYMLKTTNLTILQVSEELNFPNPSFFGRFFKKHIGITPLAYKNS